MLQIYPKNSDVVTLAPRFIASVFRRLRISGISLGGLLRFAANTFGVGRGFYPEKLVVFVVNCFSFTFKFLSL